MKKIIMMRKQIREKSCTCWSRYIESLDYNDQGSKEVKIMMMKKKCGKKLYMVNEVEER